MALINYMSSNLKMMQTGCLSIHSSFLMMRRAIRKLSKNFITDGTVVDGAYSLNVNPATGDIYIGTSDYVSTGDMFIFSAEGKKINQLEVSGLNPMGVGFLK